MALLASIPVAFVSLLHFYIMVLETCFWTTPRGLRAFNLKLDFAQQSQTLALNQGVYNGFLAAGLAWGLLHPVEDFGKQIETFFLGCVFVAGIVGAATVKPTIFFIQCVPATIAALAVVFA